MGMTLWLTSLLPLFFGLRTGESTLGWSRMQIPPFQFDRSSNDTVRVTVILPKDAVYLSSIPRVGPAISIAVSKAKNILPGWRWDVRYRDSQCSPAYGPMYAVRAYVEERVHLFLGPACDYVTASVARLLKFWDIPLLTAGALARDYGLAKSNFESEFYLLTRVGLSFNGMASCFLAVCDHFGWKRLLLVYDSKARPEIAKEDYCMLWTKALVAELRERGNFTWQPYKLSHTITDDGIVDFLKSEVGVDYGVVALCADPDRVRSILLAAAELGMINSGEHVFFSLELFTGGKLLKKPWYRESSSLKENSLAQKAYTGVFQMTGLQIATNPDFVEFVDDVKTTARNEYSFDYGKDSVTVFATGFHDAIILYSMALNKTLSDGHSITNGSLITQKMWNRSFEGIANEVTIDGNGDRLANYTILSMNHDTGDFQVVLTFDGVRRVLIEESEMEIRWPGGRMSPPLDTPICGFDHSKCPDDEIPHYAVLSGVLAGIVVILFIASFFIFRHYKLEAELASMTWKIRWEEISSTAGIRKRLGSRMSLARISIQSACSLETVQMIDFSKQMFVQTGYYRSSMVAIKPLHKNRIDITRTLLLEMKKMKDLQHDHIVRYIGACVEPPHCCMITEYCPKGSLQDILENDEIKLDWMFRYSLMHDLVKGMCFLHSSDIRSHGNLKSSNCVVDSRFVLKITDFGLHALRVYVDIENSDDSYAHWRRKLWTAPELLRKPNAPPDGTQKGDVYSFAIIAHEIVVRQGCYHLGPLEMSPKEIIENVKEGRVPLFRPLLPDGTCEDAIVSTIRRCWSEEPGDRPEFHILKTTLRRINSHNKSCNILDNLLSRMEQYANNLESLVEERTADYLEEKRKAEDLLYQLLPKSVASQLIRGQSVTAEAFDGVTIYFSDIVGFTSLSAQSTPMQIVTFLNDLYVCFDSIIENFDVYKVETIGDAYMVASGLPVRNGNLHAREIARMSIALLDAVLSFSIRHRPADQLKLRIGIHSGPCAAGVVGLRMPRYCLFGDTVNTASRMESTGEPLKIHVSPKTKEILDTFGGFLLDKRGEVELKGKGIMTTFWLKGEQYVPVTNCRSSDSFVKETKI